MKSAALAATAIATVTAKGQLVIPAKLRHKLGIRKGTKVSCQLDKNQLILQPLNREFIRSLRGSLKGDPSLLDLLTKDRHWEREL